MKAQLLEHFGAKKNFLIHIGKITHHFLLSFINSLDSSKTKPTYPKNYYTICSPKRCL